MIGAAWAFITGIFGVGTVVRWLAFAVVIPSVLTATYVKGRVDCSANYKLGIERSKVKSLEKQIRDLEKAAEESAEMARRLEQIEKTNDEFTQKIMALPVVPGQCLDARWLQGLRGVR